jgi:hypothetical protein
MFKPHNNQNKIWGFIMDRHELAMKTYEDLQKRKARKELQKKLDQQGLGWNGYEKYKNKSNKRYYDRKHTIF